MSNKITVKVNNKEYTVPEGTVLSSFIKTDMPCGGHGNCGKCKVIATGMLSPVTEAEREHLGADELSRGVRLACFTRVQGECEIFTSHSSGGVIKTDHAKSGVGKPLFTKHGIAIDIGTTTIAAAMYDKDGKCIAQGGVYNPQSAFGADVISRIGAAIDGKGDDIARAVCKALDSLTEQVAHDGGINTCDIDGAVITGNTAMLHLFTKTDVSPLSRFPFDIKRRFGEFVTADELGLQSLNPDTRCYLPPVIGAFVGADTVCALVTVRDSDNYLLVDIGTNGETVLCRDGKLLACSTAAGPAFEGAGIEMGMRAMDGAVHKVSIVNGSLHAQVIGNTEAIGICGSGLIDAVVCLLDMEEIDDSGYLEDDAVISGAVRITPSDIRALQLAKSAVRAGIETLLGKTDAAKDDLDKIYIAGGFGYHLDSGNVMKIGLLPRVAKNKLHYLGNAALIGASEILLDRALIQYCDDVCKNASHVELANDPQFTQNYMDYMFF